MTGKTILSLVAICISALALVINIINLVMILKRRKMYDDTSVVMCEPFTKEQKKALCRALLKTEAENETDN